MKLENFWRLRREYEERAKERAPEWLNSPMADMPWSDRVIIEMVIDVLIRMEKLEDLFGPAGDEKSEE